MPGHHFADEPGPSDASVADQIHPQYGTDAATEMTVFWHTTTSVSRPRIRLGTPHGGWGLEIPAETRSYVDGINAVETVCQHARATRLTPGGADGVCKAVATGSEIGTWSAVRDPDTVHPWGIATFDPRARLIPSKPALTNGAAWPVIRQAAPFVFLTSMFIGATKY